MSDPLRTLADYELLFKNHRVPAPEMSFTRPNLPRLIAEIEAVLAKEVGCPTI